MNAKQSAQWVITNAGLTYQQMLNLTPQQITDAFPNKAFSGTYIEHVLAYLRYYANEIKDAAILQGLKDQLTGGDRVWLNNSLPDHEWEKGRENGKPYITLWPEGNPNIEPPEPETPEEPEGE